MSELDNVSHLLPAGTELNSKYEVIKVIGEGGFGITYFGHNKVLDFPVAIKEYYPKGYASRTVSQNLNVTITDNTKNAYFDKWKMKFLTEARMLAKFANLPGIVNVYDFFEQNGTAYIIMEYLDGITLKNYVETNGPMDTSTFFKRLIPVLTSLEKIHKQGLIHRDISPDNLMLMNDGFLKLFDFGAAREYSDATQQNFSVIIKPCFAPEEQYRSKGVQGPWTDVYSICATIYFSITGVVPDDSLQRAFSDELKKPSELGVRISPKIEATLLKGMSVRSTDRFDSVMPLVCAFEEADSKPIRKEKKPRRKKTPKIFSIFHTSSTQAASSSTFSPISTSESEKTEIVLNTEYEPSGEQLYNPAENEVKRRLKSDLSNNPLPSVVVKSNVIANGHKASDSNIPANNKAKDNTPSNGHINGENNAGVVCSKCNAIIPNFAKFCGVCGQPFIPFKKSVNNKVSVSPGNLNTTQTEAVKANEKMCPKCKSMSPYYSESCKMCGTHFSNNNDIGNNKIELSNSSQNNPQAKSKDGVTSTTLICPKCKSVLPKNAKFCGKCGIKLSFPTTGSEKRTV